MSVIADLIRNPEVRVTAGPSYCLKASMTDYADLDSKNFLELLRNHRDVIAFFLSV